MVDEAWSQRALIQRQLAYKNLARLGVSAEEAGKKHTALVRERDTAVRGVAKLGFSQRELATAARITTQRVSQILARETLD